MTQTIKTTVIATYQGRTLGYYPNADEGYAAIAQAEEQDRKDDAGYQAWHDRKGEMK